MPSFSGIQEDCEEIVALMNHDLQLRLKVKPLKINNKLFFGLHIILIKHSLGFFVFLTANKN